jgi:hypothetical protein
MLKKIAYAAIASGLSFAPLGASAISSLPFGGVVTTLETDSPFPKDNSIDYGIRVATPGKTDGAFPKDNSIDYSVDSGIHVATPGKTDSAFPKDNSIDNSVDSGIHVAA